MHTKSTVSYTAIGIVIASALVLAACGKGSGGSTTTTTPMKAASVATGDTYTCASLPDKTVKCWGDNTYGQLGTDWILPRAYNPITVTGVTTATAVTGGGVHTCALLLNGTVSCWGSNISGQLGDGSTTDSFTPVSVSGLSNAIAITASHARLDNYGHTCALLSGGTVQCWGRNIVGQLGTGTTTDSYTPVTVSGLTGVTTVVAGGFHNCALLTGGAVQCWGDNAIGQLGDGTTTTPRTTPVAVSGVSNATALALGGDFSCALISDGTVKCWGGNGHGRLGDGVMPPGSSTPITTPVTVVGISTAIAITAGRGHACAVLSGGTVKCWGDNSAAMLGDGTTTSSATPVTTTGLSNAVALTAGAVHTCARLADNTVQCWGDNANGQVGPGSTDHSTTPATVLSFSANVQAVTTGSLHGCGLFNDSTVGCWGSNESGQLGSAGFMRSSTISVVAGITTATALTAGGWHTCSLLLDGSISCWGDNAYGQLGNGTLTNSSTPVTVSGIINGTSIWYDGVNWLPMFTTTTAVAAGSVRTCAIISEQREVAACQIGTTPPCYTFSDTVKCWGDNDQGQLGDGTITNSSVPVTVSGISTATAITGGYNHTCALLSGGTAQCWGANYSGQLGNGSTVASSMPVTVSGFTNATALGAGSMNDHACAVISGGTVQCWGDNFFGQLGNGTTTNSSTPVQVTGISTATAVAVGYGNTCALLSSGAVQCWGWNILGQLGNATTTDSSVPVTVSGLSGATAVTAGFAQSCARLSDGGVKCWGDNSYAQLGLGVLATSATTPMGISVVTRTKPGVPSCLIASLHSPTGPRQCVLDGNLVIRAGNFIMVLPLPPE